MKITNQLPITKIDEWFECTIRTAIPLDYTEYIYCNDFNKNIHGYVRIKNNIRNMEGILLLWKGNPFEMDNNHNRMDRIINICKIK